MAAATGPSAGVLAGTWRRLPQAPIAAEADTASVWTGREMLVFGRARLAPEPQRPVGKAVNVAAAYDPGSDTWRRLAPPTGPDGSFGGRYSAVWTAKEMLVWGPFDYEAFNPRTEQWRQLPPRPGIGHAGGVVVWTGREMIGWGGGCCGDAFSDGVAYNPTTNTWRNLARSPLAGSQHPTGAWTGRELDIVVSGFDPDGKPSPARLARAAAYNPATNRWRRIPALPAPRVGASAVWDGREVLVVGGTGARAPAAAAGGFAYNPRTERWRRLRGTESGRTGAAAVWTGSRLLMWGGTTRSGSLALPRTGLAYDPKANQWSRIPQATLQGRLDPTAVWTGRELIVWGGQRPATPPGTGTRSFADAAAFTPTTR